MIVWLSQIPPRSLHGVQIKVILSLKLLSQNSLLHVVLKRNLVDREIYLVIGWGRDLRLRSRIWTNMDFNWHFRDISNLCPLTFLWKRLASFSGNPVGGLCWTDQVEVLAAVEAMCVFSVAELGGGWACLWLRKAVSLNVLSTIHLLHYFFCWAFHLKIKKQEEQLQTLISNMVT